MMYPISRTTLIIVISTLAVACGDGRKSAYDALTATELAAAEDSASEVLEQFYTSARDADFSKWIALFTDDARFYGTDATEDWPKEEFAKGVAEAFATGTGWSFDVESRRVTVAPNGKTAWFVELSHFANTDYTLRPSGILLNTDDGWKISQLIMGVPFPNEIYDPVRMGLQATEAGEDTERFAVEATLDLLHERAAGGDVDAYFSLYHDEAVFIGTDATENWTLSKFRDYAEPAFSDGHGWTYIPNERQVTLSPMKNVAWFHEILDSDSYGTSRGTGVLLRSDDGWKVAQYHLTFPLPNDLADNVTAEIKAFEAASAQESADGAP